MFRAVITAAVISMALCDVALAEKSRIYTANPLENGDTYNKRARDAYEAGVWTIEEVETDSAERKMDPEERQRAYARALLAFAEAAKAEPSMYEAHTYIGYANRKVGNFDESLRAYETALKLNPNYAFAIEYQGEAYLEMGDFTRARFNYLRLYALDMKLANKLRASMDDWLGTSGARNSKDFVAARDWLERHANQ